MMKWRIQDFPVGLPTGGGIISQLFAENSIKIKYFRSRRGRTSLLAPLGSTTVMDTPIRLYSQGHTHLFEDSGAFA